MSASLVIGSPVSAGTAAAMVSIALSIFAAAFLAVTRDHPVRFQLQIAVCPIGRPCALNASTTLWTVGCSRLSQIAPASAGVGLLIRGGFGAPGQLCLLHALTVPAAIGRPAAVNRAATSRQVGRSRLW